MLCFARRDLKRRHITSQSLVEAATLEALHADIARLAIRHLGLHLHLLLHHAVRPARSRVSAGHRVQP